jgi:hypothetical protein
LDRSELASTVKVLPTPGGPAEVRHATSCYTERFGIVNLMMILRTGRPSIIIQEDLDYISNVT